MGCFELNGKNDAISLPPTLIRFSESINNVSRARRALLKEILLLEAHFVPSGTFVVI